MSLAADEREKIISEMGRSPGGDEDGYLKAVLAAMPDLVFVMDADGRIDDILAPRESAVYRAVRYMQGRKLAELFPPEQAETFLAIIRQTLEKGRGLAHEYAMETPLGRRWYEARTSVLRGLDGAADRVVWLPRDVTQGHRDRESLARGEQRLRALINAYPDMAFLLDREERFLAANAGVLARAGVASEAEILGRLLWDFLDPASVPSRHAISHTVLESGQPLRFESCSFESVLDISVYPVSDGEGAVSSLAIYARDISTLRRIEQEKLNMEARLRQQQKLESIGTLASGVAHEINNPINIIMNYGELILEAVPKDGVLAHHTREIISESERIAGIVSNLLNFARQEKEQARLTELVPVIEATLSLLREILRKNQIELQLDYAPDLPLVSCRAKQIMQVLMNLVTNARDALNERYPGYHADKRLSIHAHPHENEGRSFARIVVEDRGGGIAPTVIERIFDPFFTTKSRAEGTGLGLSVSHGIIKEHGGLLAVESEPGQFTRFTLDLPASEAQR